MRVQETRDIMDIYRDLLYGHIHLLCGTRLPPSPLLLNILLGSLVNTIRQQIEKKQGEESGEAGFRWYDCVARKQKGIFYFVSILSSLISSFMKLLKSSILHCLP